MPLTAIPGTGKDECHARPTRHPPYGRMAGQDGPPHTYGMMAGQYGPPYAARCMECRIGCGVDNIAYGAGQFLVGCECHGRPAMENVWMSVGAGGVTPQHLGSGTRMYTLVRARAHASASPRVRACVCASAHADARKLFLPSASGTTHGRCPSREIASKVRPGIRHLTLT